MGFLYNFLIKCGLFNVKLIIFSIWSDDFCWNVWNCKQSIVFIQSFFVGGSEVREMWYGKLVACSWTCGINCYTAVPGRRKKSTRSTTSMWKVLMGFSEFKIEYTIFVLNQTIKKNPLKYLMTNVQYIAAMYECC